MAAGLSLDPEWTPTTAKYPAPSYPVDAAKQHLSGACLVMFDLGVDGLPKNKIAECSDPAFSAEAVKLTGAVFEPATNKAGKAVEVKGVTYPLEFCMG